MRNSVLLLLCVALSACGAPGIARRVAPQQDSLARYFVGLVQRQSLDTAMYELSWQLARNDSTRGQLLAVSAALQGVRLDSLRVIDVRATFLSERSSAELAYETPRQPVWRVILVRIESDRIAGLHVNTDPAGLYWGNSLRWVERPAWRWPFLVFPYLALVGTLAAAVYVWRVAPRHHLPLALLALVGLTRGTLNWSTGRLAMDVIMLSFGITGGVSRSSAIQPWIVTFTLPIGAVIAVTAARRMRRRPAAAA